MAVEILIGLTGVNVLLAGYALFVIIRFERLLANASQGAADHFEKLRSVRQVGV
jgi:hypothetical protein